MEDSPDYERVRPGTLFQQIMHNLDWNHPQQLFRRLNADMKLIEWIFIQDLMELQIMKFRKLPQVNSVCFERIR